MSDCVPQQSSVFSPRYSHSMFPAKAEIQRAVDELRSVLPGNSLGLYLCGSAARGRRGPHSDLDLIALTPETLTSEERHRLTDTLLEVSGWAGHSETFPEASHRRPVDFTSIVLTNVEYRQHPPTVDYHYGEWLRAELVAGQVPQSHEDPDATLFLEDARQNHQTIFGPALQTLLSPAPSGLLTRACQDALPALMEALGEDTRNVLLTLARMAVTASTGTIVSKDGAAELAATRLPQAEASLLQQAADEYRGAVSVDWAGELHAARTLAERLGAIVNSS